MWFHQVGVVHFKWKLFAGILPESPGLFHYISNDSNAHMGYMGLPETGKQFIEILPKS